MADKSLTPIDLPELSSAPASPASGFHRFYAKTDGKAYSKSSAGTEYDLTTGVSLTTTGTSGSATLVGTTLNIPVYQSALTNPVTGTGTSGQVAYWNGTTTQTGNSNLFWDNTNGRLGIGTNTPTQKLEIVGTNILIARLKNTTSTGACAYQVANDVNASFEFGMWGSAREIFGAVAPSNAYLYGGNDLAVTSATLIKFGVGSSLQERTRINSSGNFLIGNTDGTARLQIRGSGTTSATTALLVQNSTPTELFKVLDNGNANFNNDLTVSGVFRETVTANRQAASYTLALTDRGKLVEMDVATANNLTVPLNSSIAFPVGTKIDIVQYGAGQTTIVATGGVTLRSTNNWLKINARYGAVTLVKIATDEWYVFGNLNA